MKKLSLTTVAMAVAAFVAAPSFAATNLNTGTGVQRYASELTPTSTAPILLRAGAVSDLTANVALGWGFSAATTFYVRLDIAGGTFNGAMVAGALNVNGAGAGSGVTVSQSTSSYVVFSVNQAGALDQSVRLLFAPSGTFDGINVTDKAGVSLRYRVYSDAVSAAGVTPANNGLSDTGAVSFVSFATAGYGATTSAGSGVANVASSPVYTEFVSQAPTNSNATILLGSIASSFNAAVSNENGAAFGVGAFNNTSTVVVTATAGDFSSTANANGAYDATSLARVFISTTNDCAAVNSVANVSSLTASTATFTNVAAANFAGTRHICLTARSGATIGAATFALSSTISSSATRYGNITSPTAASFGTITQNGATVYVPLAQVPSGYIARVVLTNITGTARPYTVSAITETGSTVTLTGGASSGTLAANRMNEIRLDGFMAVTGGAPRSTLRITINGPASAVRAVYQIVNVASGGISNTSLTVE